MSAGLVLLAFSLLDQSGLSVPTASQVIEALKVPRSSAYEAKKRVEQTVRQLEPRPGRPALPPRAEPSESCELTRAVLRFVCDHPGAVSGSQAHRHYSDGFRAFVVELAQTHSALSMDQLAEAVQVPAATLKPWLRVPMPSLLTNKPSEVTKSSASSGSSSASSASSSSASSSASSSSTPLVPSAPSPEKNQDDPASVQIQSVLDAWSHWQDKKRNFSAFCKHVRQHLRIDFGPGIIRDILFAQGSRIPTRRGRAPDASASRTAFETFFPGAQWMGDGTEVTVDIFGHQVCVNFELLVDVASGAFVGADVRANEDATAVTEAFADGIATTGAAPLSLLLDNKPSNHGAQVTEAVGEGLLMRPRPYTPTDKPHVEGAFGLFKSVLPDLTLQPGSPEHIATQIARFVVITWARTTNHRPRAGRKGRTRVQLYTDAVVTSEQIAAAQAELRERASKQRKANETRRRRADAQTLELLDQTFKRLELDDPQRHFRTSIASWPHEAIVRGIAIFEGKRNAGTLPSGVDAPYLRGIIKNVVGQTEGQKTAEALLRIRLQARDINLASLQRSREDIRRNNLALDKHLKRLVNEAIDSERAIDRTFWLLEAALLIRLQPDESRPALLLAASRRIFAHFKWLPYHDRLNAVQQLFANAIPLD